MFHLGGKPFEKAWLTAEELRIHAEDMQKGDDLVFQLVAKRAGTDPNELKKKFSPLKYITAKEAKREF
jgi:ATP-dependent protease ClpP protease subunit